MADKSFSVSAPTFNIHGLRVHVASGAGHRAPAFCNRSYQPGLPGSWKQVVAPGYEWDATLYHLCPRCETRHLAIPAQAGDDAEAAPKAPEVAAQITRAEIKANAYADIARKYGMKAEVDVEDGPAAYYDDGSIMLPAVRYAWVRITDGGLGVFGDHWLAGWCTALDERPGRRRTTRYMSGYLHVFCRRGRKLRTERDFARSLHAYSFRAAKEA